MVDAGVGEYQSSSHFTFLSEDWTLKESRIHNIVFVVGLLRYFID
jgi:hypothetical protein